MVEAPPVLAYGLTVSRKGGDEGPWLYRIPDGPLRMWLELLEVRLGHNLVHEMEQKRVQMMAMLDDADGDEALGMNIDTGDAFILIRIYRREFWDAEEAHQIGLGRDPTPNLTLEAVNELPV